MYSGYAPLRTFLRRFSPVWILAGYSALTLAPELGAQVTWLGGNGGNANDWTKPGNWSPSGVPVSTQTAQFTNGADAANLAPNLNGNQAVAGLTFTNVANAYTVTGNTGNTLTIGSSGITNSSANLQTFSVPTISVSASQSWNAASSGSLSISSAVTLAASTTLTITGSSTGSGTISGAVSGGGALIKDGSGTWTVSGTSKSYSGGTTVNAGTLNFSGGVPTTGNFTVNSGATLALSGTGFQANNTNLTINGGTLVLGTGTFKFTDIIISGNTTLDFGNNSAAIFNATSLRLAANASVTVTNWVAGSDSWTAGSVFANGSATALSGTGVTVSQVTFQGSSFATTWNSSGWSNQIAAVPEPSTYGAMLMAGCAGLFGLRRWRAKRRAVRS
jgi:autotransporter-associated beta strand protein